LIAHINSNDFPAGGLAVVVGASGSIGKALFTEICNSEIFDVVVPLTRRSLPMIDLLCEETILNCSQFIATKTNPLRLVVDATGILHSPNIIPEKSIKAVEGNTLSTLFQINAIGPMLLMKHFIPLFPKNGKTIFTSLSARVGSISDNKLGGWYGYRASKAALNQFIRTAAVELKRSHPESICNALHPGTVISTLSQPFSKNGLELFTPEESARKLFQVIKTFNKNDSGEFFDYEKRKIDW
jgi:NAD(P)-dependent dehydrogenase (short-subunit alcohol dehydrogenase family)